ncbi:MAG: 4-hydroxybenzoate octaprenyltransferase [Planctomycetes bacterium]|nr:4-hydroxybenzoate octaprenyltransferase [Planctomycetota bacterium]
MALRDIKLAHSVFALPFAVLGAFLVAPRSAQNATDPRIDWSRFGLMLALVVVCMFFARTWAMLVNRLADARLDAANPRTARRAFAAGRLTTRDGLLLLTASAAGFLAAGAAFGPLFANWWPLILGVPVLLWIGFYSFTKRFTFLCHVFLGGALAASPLAAAIAVGGLEALTGPHAPALWWLAGMVLLWVAGFDVIYALQDLDHDRAAGLNSLPARFGWRGAAWISRAMHAGALACLILAWRAEPAFGTVFGAAVFLVAGVLAGEHLLLATRGRAGIPMAFFTLNGVVSLILGLAGVAELLP